MKLKFEEDLIALAKIQLFNEHKYRIYHEVGIYGYYADMVLLDKDNVLYAIEFKMSNWREAIRQAKTYLIASDYSIICLPKKRYTRWIYSNCKNEGIGLWLYNFKEMHLEKVIEPRQSLQKHELLKQNIINKLITTD
jgi:hypothetical protein